MAKERAEGTGVRLKPSEKVYLETQAAKLGMTLSDLLRAGAILYASFEPAFLEVLRAKSGQAGVEPATALQQLLQTYLATEAAILSVFGGQSRTFVRAFQRDVAGLVTGDRLSRLVFEQVQAEAVEMRKKIERTLKKGSTTTITKNQAALLAARL
jgi:hypothetical protein